MSAILVTGPSLTLHTPCLKTEPFVISLYLCFDSYELQENFQKYIGGDVCCELGISVCDTLTIIC